LGVGFKCWLGYFGCCLLARGLLVYEGSRGGFF
jgi:hypothetical protein